MADCSQQCNIHVYYLLSSGLWRRLVGKVLTYVSGDRFASVFRMACPWPAERTLACFCVPSDIHVEVRKSRYIFIVKVYPFSRFNVDLLETKIIVMFLCVRCIY